MRNRNHRYNQRAYKYQEQQRVPECYQDIRDPIDDYYESYCRCGFCISSSYHGWISKEGVSPDWMSVDSDEDEHLETNNSLLSLAPLNNVDNKVQDKQERIICLNRYAVLNMEETSLEDKADEEKQGAQICSNREENEIVEDGGDWNICYSKDVRKQKRIQKRRIAEAHAYNESRSIYNPMDIQMWIDSWCNDERQTTGISTYDDVDMPIIHTDGFFRKNRKAGYGVIMRSRSGVPLVGSAGVYTRGKPVSALYHELQGINRGLELAIKYGLHKKFKVYCSSHMAADLFESMFCFCDYRLDNSVLHIACKMCIKRLIPECSEDDLQLLMYPLAQEIVDNSSILNVTVYAVKRKQNPAADYLAKLQVNKEEMEPHELPQELKAILYEDAKGGDLMPRVYRERGWWLYW